jgi:hypothetical protein
MFHTAVALVLFVSDLPTWLLFCCAALFMWCITPPHHPAGHLMPSMHGTRWVSCPSISSSESAAAVSSLHIAAACVLQELLDIATCWLIAHQALVVSSSVSPLQLHTHGMQAASFTSTIAILYSASCVTILLLTSLLLFSLSTYARASRNLQPDGFKMDGRRWKVDWASRADFELFGWRWTEGRSPSPRR